MDFKRRTELLEKTKALLDKGDGVVVCGSGFDYDIFLNFVLSELTEHYQAKITDLAWTDGLYIDLENGARLKMFDVKKPDQLEKFVADYSDPACFPLHLMILIEPPKEALKDLYNVHLLPLLLNRNAARVQVVRPG
jgi:hypothetical protein